MIETPMTKTTTVSGRCQGLVQNRVAAGRGRYRRRYRYRAEVMRPPVFPYLKHVTDCDSDSDSDPDSDDGTGEALAATLKEGLPNQADARLRSRPRFGAFGHSCLGFVSHFAIRISHFILRPTPQNPLQPSPHAIS